MKQVKCPSCRKLTPLTANPYRPFCSDRCKTIDLGAWADQKYCVPGDDCNVETEAQIRDNLEGEKIFH